MTPLKKLSKKLNLSDQEVVGIVAVHHEMECLYTKKQLKTVDLTLTDESLVFVNKISKTLKVSTGAVISYMLRKYLETK